MRKNILEKKFNVRLVKTREQIDSHRAYWEVWYKGEPIIQTAVEPHMDRDTNAARNILAKALADKAA